MPPHIFAGVSLVVLIVSFVIFWRLFKGKIQRLASFLVLFGGLANLYERVVTGCVMDFLSFFGMFSFNIPDVAITVGVLTLAVSLIIKREDENR